MSGTFVHARDIEDADVRVAPGDAPQVAPRAGALQLLRARALGGLQPLGERRVHVGRQAHVHLDVEEHRVTSP